MRSLQERLDEANGKHRIAELHKIREGRPDPATAELEGVVRAVGLEAVSKGTGVVRPKDSQRAHEEARHITDEHSTVDKDQLAAH